MDLDQSLSDIDVNRIIGAVSNFLCFGLRVILFAKLLEEEVLIDVPLKPQMHEQEEKVRAKDESQKRVEDYSQADQLHKISILCRKVDHAEEHEHLHGFG